MNERAFEGVFSLLLTPFHDDLSIDWAGYERYVAWQLAHQPNGLFAVCGSSEMKWLDLEERLELARRAVRASDGAPVAATGNLGADLVSHAEEVARMADTGVAAIVLVPPDGMGRDQERLEDYFAGLIDVAPCPTILYEWPEAHPHLIDADAFGRLARGHDLAGIKDTTCTHEGIAAKIALADGATVFQANAPYMLQSIRSGVRGIMAIVSTAAADAAIAFWRAATAETSPDGGGDVEALHEVLVLLDCALGRAGAYPATAKHLAGLRGVPIGPACRSPVRAPDEALVAVDVWYRHALRINGLVEPTRL
ncbi:MAG: dihydrodipicolinate synthase family protein [Deinococcales bacterium]